jgi:inorganic pyrophosphatase
VRTALTRRSQRAIACRAHIWLVKSELSVDQPVPMLSAVVGDSEWLVCVVEIPKGGRNKYEYDPALRGIRFDRFLMTAAAYPTDYGYIPDTLGQDGDVLDALVCLTEPTFPGCLIPAKPIGLFKMRDEQGIDDKVICVPLADPNWSGYDELDQLPALLRDEVEQFFSIYKRLENKEVVVDGWRPREDAEREIADARERFRSHVEESPDPAFKGPGGRLPAPKRQQ